MNEQPKYRIEIFWSEEDGGYIANIPELKYTSAFGETREEALREVLEAEELHLETLEEMGRAFPKPDVHAVKEKQDESSVVARYDVNAWWDVLDQVFRDELSGASADYSTSVSIEVGERTFDDELIASNDDLLSRLSRS